MLCYKSVVRKEIDHTLYIVIFTFLLANGSLDLVPATLKADLQVQIEVKVTRYTARLMKYSKVVQADTLRVYIILSNKLAQIASGELKR